MPKLQRGLLLGRGGERLHELRRGHLSGQHRFCHMLELHPRNLRGDHRVPFALELRQLPRGYLLGGGCERMYELRGGDPPARLKVVELPFLHHRNLLGRGRHSVLKLPSGDLRAQHGRRELFQLRGGHVPHDQRRDRIDKLFHLRRRHVLDCWFGCLFELRGRYVSGHRWGVALFKLPRWKNLGGRCE